MLRSRLWAKILAGAGGHRLWATQLQYLAACLWAEELLSRASTITVAQAPMYTSNPVWKPLLL